MSISHLTLLVYDSNPDLLNPEYGNNSDDEDEEGGGCKHYFDLSPCPDMKIDLNVAEHDEFDDGAEDTGYLDHEFGEPDEAEDDAPALYDNPAAVTGAVTAAQTDAGSALYDNPAAVTSADFGDMDVEQEEEEAPADAEGYLDVEGEDDFDGSAGQFDENIDMENMYGDLSDEDE